MKVFIIFILLVGLITSGVFIAINLPNSLPGELIYPLKIISENLRLSANELSAEGRAEVFIDLSDTRLNEFEKLVAKKEYSKIPEALDQMAIMQKKALSNIEQARGHGADIKTLLLNLESSLQKQQSTLEELYFEVTPEIYKDLDKILESTQKNLDDVAINLSSYGRKSI